MWGQGGYFPLLARVAREALKRFFMARYEHLPIYKQAMDVAVHFEKVVAGFSDEDGVLYLAQNTRPRSRLTPFPFPCAPTPTLTGFVRFRSATTR